MKRLFVALPITASDTIVHLLDSLKRQLSHERINWVRAENMHLTLKFLGESPESKIAEISGVLTEATQKVHAFGYCFNKTGLFGSRHSPRVLWMGMMERNLQLEQLAEMVIEVLDSVGFPRDRQNFVPHLTLGRILRLTDKKLFFKVVNEIPQIDYLCGNANEILLYESILSSKGPRYVVLERFPFSSAFSLGGV